MDLTSLPSLFLFQEPQATSPIVQFLPWILIIAIFYFLLFRPQMKERREAQAMRKNLKKGARVLTQGGLLVKVHQVKESEVIIELEGGSKARLVKEAVIRQLDEGTGEGAPESSANAKGAAA